MVAEETFVRPLGMAFVVMTQVARHPLLDPSNVVEDMIASSSLPSTMLMTLEWYVDVRYLRHDSSLKEPNIDSTRLAVVALATCLAPLPALNRVPDPASLSTQPVVEA